MYPNPSRHTSLNIAPQNFVPAPPQYTDFSGYHHHVTGISDSHHVQPASAWAAPYAPGRDDWHGFGTGNGASPSGPGQLAFSPADFTAMQPPPAGILAPINSSLPQLSPTAQRRNAYDWMRRNVPTNTQGTDQCWGTIPRAPALQPNGQPSFAGVHRESNLQSSGKTRTKDKYRVVYTDHQRLELEKEFHYSRYITIRRKAELSVSLGLSERQVKIWFQNRRAKERKINKKKLQQQSQAASTTTPTPPGASCVSAIGMVSSSSVGSTGNLLSQSIPMTIKEEYLP
eukprot:gi/632979193/ref/XP_007906333.1/ PREDICTED: homeobox protein CDX-1 [Callorhinchus milii]